MFFPWPQYSPESWRESLCRSPGFPSLLTLSSLVLCCRNSADSALSPQSGTLLVSPPCTTEWKLSQGSNPEQSIVGLISFDSCFKRISVLCCLVFSVFKTAFSYIWSGFFVVVVLIISDRKINPNPCCKCHLGWKVTVFF